MGTTQYGAHDRQVVVELKQLGDGATAGEKFARALELEATPVLLAGLATNYRELGPDGWTVVGLPYVEKLLAASWDLARVREFLHGLCFNETEYEGICSTHRQGFWRNKSVWAIFDSDTFVAFMREFAATPDSAKHVLTELGHEDLEMHLALWRQDGRQAQRDVRTIEAVAASHLTFIENQYQLRQMIRYAVIGHDNARVVRELARRAGNVGWWGWNLVFRGYALAKLQPYTYEHNLLWGELDDILRYNPQWGAAPYRWLAEGFWREHNELWEVRLDGSFLQSLFGQHGWHFARVTQMSGSLQAVFTINGKRIIVRHIPGSEPLKTDDAVMLHGSELEDKQPRIQPGGKAYELTLTPARRPTPEQLADVRGQFPKKR